MKSPDVERELQALLGLRREDAPIHVVLRWTRDDRVDTIAEHKDIADARGSVWWGKAGDPAGRRALSDRQPRHHQGAAGRRRPTFAYLYGMGTAWRTKVSAVTLDEADVESDLVPTTTVTLAHNLWLQLSEFEHLEA